MNLSESFLLGITLGISIGPIAVLIFNNGLVYNKRAGFSSGLGAAMADFTFALAGFGLGAALSRLIDDYRQLLCILSGITLILFGVYMLVNAWPKMSATQAAAKTSKNFFRDTYLLTLTNPLTILLFTGFAGRMNVASSTEAFLNAAAVFTGSLIIQSVLGLGGAYLGNFINDPQIIRGLRIISAVVIVLFGVSALV